jgi:putative zinc finger protein
MTCPQETYLAAYVLGGLEPDEESRLRRHLDDCAHCRDALIDLAWIPSWLHKVPDEEIELLIAEDEAERDPEPATTPPVVEAALASIATERRIQRNRWRAAVAVAAALVVVAVGVTAELVHDSGTPTAGSTVESVDQRTRVSAAVTMTPQGAKTGLRLSLSGVAPGEHCSLIVRSTDGRSDVAATWVATYRGTADIPATTTIPASRLSGFDVVTTDGRLLARLAVPPHR